MVKAYGRTLLFFASVSLSWLAAFASGPNVDPIIDKESPFWSVAYSAGSLLGWLGLFGGGIWAATLSGAAVGLISGFAWGFLVAPVVVVVVMRLLFPGISGRLQAQIDEVSRARRDRAGAR
jgi:hypothetical protein